MKTDEAEEAEDRVHDRPRIAACRARASSCSTPSGRARCRTPTSTATRGPTRSGTSPRAVGGLDLPNLEALGLGNVEPLEGCPPQPGAPAVAGRLLERSKGKDTTTGHWELMGVVTPQPFPTYPHGFPHDVIDPFMHRTGRGVLGNKAGVGDGDHPGARRGAPADRASGSSTRRPTRSSRSPRTRRRSRSRSSTTACRDRARDPRRQARGRARDRAARSSASPGNYERTPNRHDFSLEPKRPELPLARSRRRRRRSTASARSATSSPAATSTSRTRRSRTSRGSRRPSELLRELDDGLRLHEPRRDGHALGPPQRPGELPPLPPGLRPAAARTSSTRCGRATCSCSRPTTAATRRRRRPTIRASTRCCSPTSRAGTRPARSTRASSRTSARR